jgi:acetoin utilization deacetylase AcuC-like enzyme
LTTGYIYDPIFLQHEMAGHVESPERLGAIMSKLENDGILEKLKQITFEPAKGNDLLLVHTQEMIRRIVSAAAEAPSWLDMDTYVSADSYQVALAAVGGGMALVSQIAAGTLTNGIALLRPPGHHATVTRSMGFCLFNNIAIAARYLQEHHQVEKIAIIDWDVHHGNGTQDIFYYDPTVFYMSTHLFPHYPGTGGKQEIGEGKGRGTTLNFPLGHGCTRNQYMECFEKGLEIIREFQPDFILISAGFDSHADDPLGGLCLEEEDFALLTTKICNLAQETCNGRVASFLEGGYDLEKMAASVLSHIQVLLDNS